MPRVPNWTVKRILILKYQSRTFVHKRPISIHDRKGILLQSAYSSLPSVSGIIIFNDLAQTTVPSTLQCRLNPELPRSPPNCVNHIIQVIAVLSILSCATLITPSSWVCATRVSRQHFGAGRAVNSNNWVRRETFCTFSSTSNAYLVFRYSSIQISIHYIYRQGTQFEKG